LPAFEDVLIAVIVTESFAFVATNEWVRTAVADSPSVIESVAASIVSEFAITVAEDGATESIPNPNAATATSAMRLIDVVVDICFLSISRGQEFPTLGFNSKGLSYCPTESFLMNIFVSIRNLFNLRGSTSSKYLLLKGSTPL
jgi:hypothetical protein